MVRVEEDVSDAELDALHELGVRALRLDLFAGPSSRQPRSSTTYAGWPLRTSPRGWHLQFYTPGRVVRDLLPFLADFDQPFVIDHMGYMKEEDGLTLSDADRLLAVLRDNDNCWIKLSGPYRIAEDKPLSTVRELGRALVATRAGPADLGLRLATPPQRPARHRRAARPAGRVGAGRAGPHEDPGRRCRSSSSSTADAPMLREQKGLSGR